MRNPTDISYAYHIKITSSRCPPPKNYFSNKSNYNKDQHFMLLLQTRRKQERKFILLGRQASTDVARVGRAGLILGNVRII